ncbi:MAG TPA: thioredoxin family protein [Gammaproteobacteria bacterium]|nr:thioredoxin family protein [Gammaproteobacteria bacterium]
MSLVASTMPQLGAPAPAFTLTDPRDGPVGLHNFDEASALLVVFIANHCPYCQHILRALVAMAGEYEERGLATVAISANDPEGFPDDAPARMAEEAERQGFRFPYLFDETQEVAKGYRAACTPDFFLYDQDRRLYYRGRFDDSRPDNEEPVTGEALRQAIEKLLAGEPPPEPQKPSVGCNIKWRPGNEPDYLE